MLSEDVRKGVRKLSLGQKELSNKDQLKQFSSLKVSEPNASFRCS